MSKSRFVPDIKRLDRDEWETLRDIRLTALAESPGAFLHTYDEEKQFGEARWQAEFDRGSWHICEDAGQPIGLIGIAPEPQIPSDECYLEYIWVSPGHRRWGTASDLVTYAIELLRDARCELAYLWILDGNDKAMGLYKKLGFVSTNERQELPDRPGLYEERMLLDLRGPGAEGPGAEGPAAEGPGAEVET